MPAFDTPGPISVTVEFGVGDLRIVASDRPDTVVEVRPNDESRRADVTAAQQTRVEYASGKLLIKAPKGWRQYSFRGGSESINVHIDLPTGSTVRGELGVATFHGSGQLGACHFKTGVGDIHIDQVGDAAELKTGAGDITVGRVAGHAEVTTASGIVRIGDIGSTGVIKNSNGETWIGEAVGDLRVNGANGMIVVETAQASVAAKTANGDIRIDEVTSGAILAETAYGKVDLGIRDGVAAWLDLSTGFGNVQSDLDAGGSPEAGEGNVEVRARTAFGDITIRRATSPRTTR